jgi:hypothetical protein
VEVRGIEECQWHLRCQEKNYVALKRFTRLYLLGHGANAKCAVQTLVLTQEELTKEEMEDPYVTRLPKAGVVR